jgi:hypothetical protein
MVIKPFCEQINGGEIGEEFGTYAKKEKIIQVLVGEGGGLKNMPLERPLGGRILKWILYEQDGRAWAGFIWLQIQTRGRLL